MSLKGEAEEEDDVDELFLLQQITLCLPLASMAQKKPSSPNAAEIGPIDPNPDAAATRRSNRREISGRERRRSKGVRICIVAMLGLDQGCHGQEEEEEREWLWFLKWKTMTLLVVWLFLLLAGPSGDCDNIFWGG